jgi:hypothetical protein
VVRFDDLARDGAQQHPADAGASALAHGDQKRVLFIGRRNDDLRRPLCGHDQELDEALEELREMAHGLYPPLLASDGLTAALAAAARHAGIPVEMHALDIPRLPRAIESAVADGYGLNNLVRPPGGARRRSGGL